jgi:hypothetical protein
MKRQIVLLTLDDQINNTNKNVLLHKKSKNFDLNPNNIYEIVKKIYYEKSRNFENTNKTLKRHYELKNLAHNQINIHKDKYEIPSLNLSRYFLFTLCGQKHETQSHYRILIANHQEFFDPSQILRSVEKQFTPYEFDDLQDFVVKFLTNEPAYRHIGATQVNILRIK